MEFRGCLPGMREVVSENVGEEEYESSYNWLENIIVPLQDYVKARFFFDNIGAYP